MQSTSAIGSDDPESDGAQASDPRRRGDAPIDRLIQRLLYPPTAEIRAAAEAIAVLQRQLEQDTQEVAADRKSSSDTTDSRADPRIPLLRQRQQSIVQDLADLAGFDLPSFDQHLAIARSAAELAVQALGENTLASLELARTSQTAVADRVSRAAQATPSSTSPQDYRERYNQFITDLDRVGDQAGLLLDRDSALARRVAGYPDELRTYFQPQPRPAWFEPAKMQRAQELWKHNSLLVILVLYSRSLPLCYLDGEIASALIKSGRLKRDSTGLQRLYETALFVESVMAPRGIVSVAGEAGEMFLTGPGVREAKKVRILHAALRALLLTERRRHRPQPPAHGGSLPSRPMPINQFHLAFVLQTFGEAIPSGMRHWGHPLSDADGDAIVHLWRVVGHLIGIEEHLLASDWSEASALVEQVVAEQDPARNRGPGFELTDTLCEFIERFLPYDNGDLIGELMIRDQLGHGRAALVLNPRRFEEASRIELRTVTVLVRTVAGICLKVIHGWLRRTPLQEVFTGPAVNVATQSFLQSCRDYTMAPFRLPRDLDEPPPSDDRGSDDEATARAAAELKAWRVGLYERLVLGVIGLAAAVLSALAGLWAGLTGGPLGILIALTLASICLSLGFYSLAVSVPRHAAVRPQGWDEHHRRQLIDLTASAPGRDVRSGAPQPARERSSPRRP